MLKMLTTQLTGLLQRIASDQEETIEEAARLLAQAGITDGKVYFACFGEMKALEYNAAHAEEPFAKMTPWTDDAAITDMDRVLIVTRHANDEEALTLAQTLYDQFIPFAVITSEKEADAGKMADLAYVYVSLKMKQGLIPNDIGERIVVPHLLAALYLYEAIKVHYDDMLFNDEE
ncbi:hypothetical protein QI30_12190 [Kurthia sp. 3B1D]|uniref:DUF2529 domain-containing protein n=1 Tax=Candidatus Kurthia intestinigallinarum TaxID=1562256 RepID=A0A433RU46_9BACL|nr:DUF2529 family protein [Kurthia sp. 3B1D]RUS55668.1 hypothetical protein QI30_12190 [Kurthia sp. 3B1D]HIX43747.1 DUF2529 domain-containing protein [Candidatus Kurthia intestinigallinarum]